MIELVEKNPIAIPLPNLYRIFISCIEPKFFEKILIFFFICKILFGINLSFQQFAKGENGDKYLGDGHICMGKICLLQHELLLFIFQFPYNLFPPISGINSRGNFLFLF